MRVAVDATALGSGQGGDETMMRGLLRGLAAAARAGDRYDLVTRRGASPPEGVAGHPQFPVTAVPRLPGPAHFAAGLPAALARLARSSRPELVCALNHGPVWSPAPVALVVQDLSFHHHPELYPRCTRLRLRTVVPRQARRAGGVVTISEFSRRDLMASYGLRPGLVHVVPDAVEEPPPWTAADAAAGRAWLAGVGVTGRFVLHLGNVHPRKNVVRLVRAFGRMRASGPDVGDVHLVVAGARWWGRGEEEAARAEAPPGSVVFLGRVDDTRREQLLRLADVLAYVSVFEGFGLPPLEAMARGTAVVASATTAVAETAGAGALLVDPHDDAAIATGLGRVLRDDGERARLVRAGVDRVARYTVERTGEAARCAFARVLAGAPPREAPVR